VTFLFTEEKEQKIRGKIFLKKRERGGLRSPHVAVVRACQVDSAERRVHAREQASLHGVLRELTTLEFLLCS
jgi:hypothetical protein